MTQEAHEWTTPPSTENPRWQLKYVWQLQDWDGEDSNTVELSATTFEEARKEAQAIIDQHDADVEPELVGRVTRARIEQVVNVFEVPLGQ